MARKSSIGYRHCIPTDVDYRNLPKLLNNAIAVPCCAMCLAVRFKRYRCIGALLACSVPHPIQILFYGVRRNRSDAATIGQVSRRSAAHGCAYRKVLRCRSAWPSVGAENFC
jgi:hypothetical protein